jgi:hypothetical protein
MREHRIPIYRQIDWQTVAELAIVLIFVAISGFIFLYFPYYNDNSDKKLDVAPQSQINEMPTSQPETPLMSITEEPRAFFGRQITQLAEQLFARIIIPSERMEIYMKAVAEVENSNTVGVAGELGRWQFTKDCWDEGWGFWIKSGLVKKAPAFTWDNCNNPTYAACVISGYAMRYEPEEWMFFCINDNPGSVFVLAMLHHAGPSWRTKSKKKFEDASEYADRVVNIVLFGKEVK